MKSIPLTGFSLRNLICAQRWCVFEFASTIRAFPEKIPHPKAWLMATRNALRIIKRKARSLLH
jgi:hypothetical protein